MEDINKEKEVSQEKLDNMKELLNNEDIQRMWMRMHTPWIRNKQKVGRNEICPFCNSGKKYKHCKCYEERFVTKYKLDVKHTAGWR